MKKVIDRISDFFYKSYLLIACLLVCVLFLSSAVQVVCRYVLNASQSWTEELARYSFIWAMMLGAACLVKAKGHAVVDFVAKKWRGPAKMAQQITVIAVMFAFGMLLVLKGIPLLSIVARQKSSCLKLPMWIVYLAVPCFGLGTCVHSLDEFVHLLLPDASPASAGETGAEAEKE